MTIGKGMLVAALVFAVFLARGFHLTVRVWPGGSFAIVHVLDREVISFASGDAASPVEPPLLEPASTIQI